MEETTLSVNDIYRSLNQAQKQAVDKVDGPLLVLAGPGTGKTQLLSVRVANIMQTTDTPPQNILCLTFTESGAANMRERLSRFIGQAAYDVQIGTYHSFGSEIIRRYPEYFTETRLQHPVDNLGKYQIVQEIVDGLSYRNPLKQTRHHLHDLLSTISEVKRALLSSKDLRAIARENLVFIEAVDTDLTEIFADFKIMPRKLEAAVPYFQAVMQSLQINAPTEPVHARYGSLSGVAIQQLTSALDEAHSSGKTTPLTAWKTKWLAKDNDNNFVLQHNLETRRLKALADVLEAYQKALEERSLYDFDDMILRTIEVLEHNKNLKYTLQEQYLYILLDEFQDTNAAQLRLIELLTDNPVNEGRPNVMAVGDDDQAIYTFQGAQYSNMLDFYNMYQDVTVINLTDNYRSHNDILEAAQNIALQIGGRLTNELTEITKTLAAKAQHKNEAVIQRCEFHSDIEQNEWIAQEIKKLISEGAHPSDIAVLAPRHKYLEQIVPYLQNLEIPVRYEKRENILEAPVVIQILLMARLVQALSENNIPLANALWPQVLSFEFWRFTPSDIWQLSWQVTDGSTIKNWTKAMLEDGHAFRSAALLFLTLAGKISTETCDSMLDYLVGNAILHTNEKDVPTVSSPLRDYYLNSKQQKKNAELFYKTLSNINVLRARLREHEATSENVLLLPDLLAYVDMYLAAGEQMIDTSPYNLQADSVQLMTVFKAKGLEFEHVFLPFCLDEVWGGSNRGGSNKLTLPANLTPIRYSGVTDDERLRILFVAITRAKTGLYVSSYEHSYSGKATKRLRYLNEQEQENGQVITQVLPSSFNTVIRHKISAPKLETLIIDWRAQHLDEMAKANLKALLSGRLNSYRLSPTHLVTFLDLEYGGPRRFFFDTILRFPRAPSTDIQFGNSVHETLEWIQYYVNEHNGKAPNMKDTLDQFAARLQAKKLLQLQYELELERGEIALQAYLGQNMRLFKPTDKAEVSFRNEGVVLSDVQMSGKIDRLEIDDDNKTITVVDYKTGKGATRWTSDLKLHRYKHQLYCYKILLEHSHSYSDYKVTEGRLDFIEPDANDNLASLTLAFNEQEQKHTEQLIKAIWQHIHTLNFPDTSTYDATAAGIKKFEQDLIDGII
jgi:DNA helicase-2/ATP-dependent DNA helicase PcrA